MPVSFGSPIGADALPAIYDALAADYDRDRGAFDISSVIADFQARLPVKGRLLDLGCGAGEPVARAFIEHGWQVTGVDFSAAFLELAAMHVPAMHRVAGDMRHVELPESSFDAVCAIYSLFHVPRADHPGLFGRIHAWLRPGGLLLFTYATRAWTGENQFEGCLPFMGQSLFYSHDSPSGMVAAMASAGIELVEARERDIGGETFLWVTARRS